MSNIKKLIFAITLSLFSIQCFGLNFTLPSKDNNIVGKIQTATVRDNENFSDIAQRYDIGYYELFEANPGVDPDNPEKNTILIVPTQYIIPPELHNNMVINLAEMRLYYQPKGQNRVYIYPIGIGKEDWNTPLGVLKITQKEIDPKWVVPESVYRFRKSIGKPIERVQQPGPDNPMGKYAMRTSISTILIHGNNIPESVGRRSTSGCIRLYNDDIDQLFHMVPLGTQVHITNNPYKAGWENGKLFLEAHMPLLEQRLQIGDDVSPAIRVVENIAKTSRASINWNKVTEIARHHLGIPQPLA